MLVVRPIDPRDLGFMPDAAVVRLVSWEEPRAIGRYVQISERAIYAPNTRNALDPYGLWDDDDAEEFRMSRQAMFDREF